MDFLTQYETLLLGTIVTAAVVLFLYGAWYFLGSDCCDKKGK